MHVQQPQPGTLPGELEWRALLRDVSSLRSSNPPRSTGPMASPGEPVSGRTKRAGCEIVEPPLFPKAFPEGLRPNTYRPASHPVSWPLVSHSWLTLCGKQGTPQRNERGPRSRARYTRCHRGFGSKKSGAQGYAFHEIPCSRLRVRATLGRQDQSAQDGRHARRTVQLLPYTNGRSRTPSLGRASRSRSRTGAARRYLGRAPAIKAIRGALSRAGSRHRIA